MSTTNITPRYSTIQTKSIIENKNQRNQKPILRSRNGSHDPMKRNGLPHIQTLHDDSVHINYLLPVNLRSQSNTNRRNIKHQASSKNLRDLRSLVPAGGANENSRVTKTVEKHVISTSQILVVKKEPRRQALNKRVPLLKINQTTKNHQPRQKSFSPLRNNLKSNLTISTTKTIDLDTTIEEKLPQESKAIDYVLRDLDNYFAGALEEPKLKNRFNNKTPIRIIRNKEDQSARMRNDLGRALISTRERTDSRGPGMLRCAKSRFESSPVSLQNIEDETPTFAKKEDNNKSILPRNKLVLSMKSKIFSLENIRTTINTPSLSIDIHNLLRNTKPQRKIKKNILTPKIMSLTQIESSRRSDLSIDEILIPDEYEKNVMILKEFAEGFKRRIFQNTLKLPREMMYINKLNNALLRLKLLNRNRNKKPKYSVVFGRPLII